MLHEGVWLKLTLVGLVRMPAVYYREESDIEKWNQGNNTLGKLQHAIGRNCPQPPPETLVLDLPSLSTRDS